MMTRTTMHPFKILAAVGVAFVMWGLVLAYASSPAWAAEITVNTTADEQNSDGDCSLREAITAANTDAAVDGCAAATGEDTIVFDLGSSATITLDSLLGQLPTITDADGLTIDGSGAQITVSGGDQVRVLSVSGGAQLDLENLTVSGGRNVTDDFGGGLYNEGGTLNVTDSTFSGNNSDLGGGIYNNSGKLTVTGSTFSGNGAQVGGGIFNGNTPGGATVINSTFSGNFASNSGGAISNQLGGSSMDVTGSTFSGNSSGLFGGAIFGGPITGTTFRNSVFANNPSGRGGSCFVDTSFGARITDGGYNMEDGTSCGFSTANNSQPSTNPLLGPLQDNGGPTQTHALRKGSPALDQGNSFETTTDQRGESRPHDFADIDNASDGDGSDIGAFEAQVPPNDVPTVEGDSYSTNEETTLTEAAPGVLTNDDDADGDPLTADLVDNVKNGTLTLNPDGSFTYTPNANFNGTDTFTYKANDGTADSDVATVSITVTPVNDAPEAKDDPVTTAEDTPTNIAVLSNDSDVDGDTLSITGVTNPAHGTAVVDNGKINYTPAQDYNGPDSLTYKASDGNGGEDTATVSISVTPVNDKPVAINDSATVNEGGNVGGDVLSNDNDVDDDALAAVLVRGPANGTLTLNPDGTFSYTHNGSETTSDSFTYKASDGTLASNVATVSINVSAVNEVPTVEVAAGGECGTNDRSGQINLTLNDPDGQRQTQSLTLSATSNNPTLVPASNVTFGGSGPRRTMSLSAADGESGTANIRITVSDASLKSTKVVSVKVGTNKADAINGTARADMLFGLDGVDALNGLEGNDLLCGGKGVDALNGTNGDDTLFGGSGNDVLKGGSGADHLFGGSGNDGLYGDNGADRLGGGAGADSFSGGAGEDVATDFDTGEGDTRDASIP